MPTEQLIRDYYNAMYSVHTQPGNVYDMGEHLHDLTVHKHLDQDPLIQFREAYQWLHQAGAQLVADAGCGYGGFAVFVASQAPALRVDGYTLSDVQQAVAQQVFTRLHLPQARVLLQSYDRLVRQYDAIVAIESLGHAANVGATLQHWAQHLRPGGLVVLIDEIFRPDVSPAHPEIQQFLQFWRFSLLLQRARVEALVHAAGLHIAAWDILSERYRIPNRPDEECDRLLHAYQHAGAHPGYIGGMLLEKFYNRGWVDYVLLVLTQHSARGRGAVKLVSGGSGTGRPKPLRPRSGGEAMQPRHEPGPLYFIEPPLGHLSGGSMYNLEMVKRLERDALGKSFFHPLHGPVSELVQHFQSWPVRCVLVLDGLYVSIPEFKASLQQWLPYARRTYLMLHYLESMNAYYTAETKAALWAGEQLWLRAVRGMIVPSQQLREYLARQGIDKAKIAVASPGIEKVPAGRLPHPKALSATDPITLIMVGPLSRGKGQLDVVHMLARMPVTHFRLHLIGHYEPNASYTGEIRALIQRSYLQDSIMLHGSVPQPALFELLPQCDLYLSASSYESYSMATAEAVAHGLPVVAYATGAIGDWIEDGVNGMLIELGQPEQFFQALRRLLTERHALNQLRHNAWVRTEHLAFHSWEETYRDFLQALSG